MTSVWWFPNHVTNQYSSWYTWFVSMVERGLTDLITLHVLLEERQVTRAARRLGITQSSMSHRLALLRQHLDDPLFVRTGSKLVPTPRALEMAEPLKDGLAKLEEAIEGPSDFDPSRASFEIELHAPDLVIPVVLELSRALVEEAPGITLRVRNVAADLNSRLSAQERSLALVPAQLLDDAMRRRAVGDARFEIVGRAGHPLFKRPVTRKRWLAYPQVIVVTGNRRPNAIEEALREQKLKRTVGLEVPSFLAALLALVNTDLLMNAPAPVGNEAFAAMGLRSVRPPFALPTARLFLGWHERFQHDPGHRWVRERAFSLFRFRFDEAKGKKRTKGE